MAIFRLCCLGLFSAALCAAQSPPPGSLQAEIQELKTVVETLRAENRLLETRNQQLMGDILNLGHRIRELTAQLEQNSPAVPPRTAPEEDVVNAAPKKTAMHPILSVNVNWHYLIVKAGSASGIQTGESGSVIRDGEIIASVKVTDAKPRQSIVQLDLNSLSKEGVYPRTDDKVRFP